MLGSWFVILLPELQFVIMYGLPGICWSFCSGLFFLFVGLHCLWSLQPCFTSEASRCRELDSKWGKWSIRVTSLWNCNNVYDIVTGLVLRYSAVDCHAQAWLSSSYEPREKTFAAVTLSMGKEITPASTCVPDQIGSKGCSATPYPTLPQLSILGLLLALMSV